MALTLWYLRDVPTNVPNTESIKLLPNDLPKEVAEYIHSAKNLGFKATPRKNVLFPWMPDIQIKVSSSFDDCFRKYLLMTATELGYRQLTSKQQYKLANAIVARKSFLAGYPKPVVTPSTFHRKWWLKYDNERRTNPTNAPYVLNNRFGENRIGYVKYLRAEYPSFLHECYRHATKVLGVAETAKNLCISMNEYARDKYSHCEIRGSLEMTKWHF